ncbi:MAG: caspase family protein [Pseudomonadota bacterium]
MSDLQEVEIEKLKAEAQKAKAEAKKIEFELSRPWFKRTALFQAIAAGFVAVPLVWFYVTEVAIPLYEIETISLTRKNEETALELQKREREFDARLTQLVQEKDSQERDYLLRLSSLEAQKEQLERDRKVLGEQYAAILSEQEISEERRESLENDAIKLLRELKLSQMELAEIRRARNEQTKIASSTAEAVASELEKLRPIYSADPSLYSTSEALVVHVSDYDDPSIPDLPGAKVDGAEVSHLFRRLGFETTTLWNPKKSEIESASLEIIGRLDENSRFIVYWVGHGYPVDQAGVRRGYFTPRDCKPESLEGCIQMEFLTDLLERSNGSSSAAIVDTSFANLAFPSSRGLVIFSEAETSRRSREVISATNANGLALDTVPGGKGPIAKALIEGLGEAEADFNGDGVIRMLELYQFITQSVVASTGGRQIPTYANLLPNGGEMVFFVSDAVEVLQQ